MFLPLAIPPDDVRTALTSASDRAKERRMLRTTEKEVLLAWDAREYRFSKDRVRL